MDHKRIDLSKLRADLGQLDQIRSRLAPSPTGFLHLGHVFSAIFTRALLDELSGNWILRIEDHDGQRCRKQFVDQIIDDLSWIDLIDKDMPIIDQSSRHQRYTQVINGLMMTDDAYRCRCTRKVIRDHSVQLFTNSEHSELFYPGTCREIAVPASEDHAIRFRLSKRDLAEQVFVDALLGQMTQNPVQQCGDFVLRDRHGFFSYHLANVVDDLDQGINLVVRGQDLLASTGRQLALRRHLDEYAGPVTFVHHPLIYHAKESQRKLSKRQLDTSITQMRLEGIGPERIRALALLPMSLASEHESLSLSDAKSRIIEAFCC